MLARALSCALRGLAGVPVTVEADIAPGILGFAVVGLTDRAIQEARDRVKAAGRSAGLDFPHRKLICNLALGVQATARTTAGARWPERTAPSM